MTAPDLARAGAPADGSEPALVPGLLDELLGFHLRLAQAALYRDFARSLARLDLSQRQFAVLELVRANPGVSQARLAAFLALDRPAIMSVVDRLELRALVLRERSRTDRRRQEIRLTAEGEALLADAARLVRRHDSRFASRLSRGELKALVAALRRLRSRSEQPISPDRTVP